MQIGCIVNHNSSRALELWNKLVQRYDLCELDLFAKFSCRQNSQVVVLGGDGFMIKAMHGHMSHGVHFYGINCGTLGFLMNSFDIERDNLQKKIANAMPNKLHLIRAKIFTTSGFIISTYAINEVALLRRSMQAIHVRVSIDGISRIDCLVGDGIMLATPTGSTAYNFSAGGPILPMHSGLFALTPVSPFRPRRWRGAMLLQSVRVTFEVLDGDKRPAGLSVDHKLFTDIAGVEMSLCCSYYPTVFFDPGHELELRIIGEQFSH